MKQFWTGIGILAVLLVLGLWLGDAMEDIHIRQAKDLEKAATAAIDENWSLATALCTRAERDWTRKRNLTAALYRHDVIEPIDAGFSALKNYAACADAAAFSGTCAQLARQLQSLPDSHTFHWWNLL